MINSLSLFFFILFHVLSCFNFLFHVDCFKSNKCHKSNSFMSFYVFHECAILANHSNSEKSFALQIKKEWKIYIRKSWVLCQSGGKWVKNCFQLNAAAYFYCCRWCLCSPRAHKHTKKEEIKEKIGKS